MSFESFKTEIESPIESNDLNEREEILSEKILEISLIYADKKFKDIKKYNPDYKFSEAIKNFTPVKENILESVYNLENFKTSEYKDKIDSFLNQFYEELDSVTQLGDFNLDTILNLIENKSTSIKGYLGLNEFKKKEKNKKEERDLVRYHETSFEYDKKLCKNLMEIGFSELDKYIAIHLRPFFSINKKQFGLNLIKESLSKIALDIINKEPKTAAVIGTSWVLDTPIANRLGFIRLKDDSTLKQDNASTWYQFIDQNGQINKKRFNEFLETGELPFKSVRSYIPVIDFLKKYLPEEYRGKTIVLKEIDEKKEKNYLRIRNESQNLRKLWSDILKKNGDFNTFLNNKDFIEVFNFLSLENRNIYTEFFKEMYDKKIEWNDFSKYQSEEFKERSKQVEKDFSNSIYKNKEIIIE